MLDKLLQLGFNGLTVQTIDRYSLFDSKVCDEGQLCVKRRTLWVTSSNMFAMCYHRSEQLGVLQLQCIPLSE